MNLARATRQRKLAALEGAANAGDQEKALTTYELMMKSLYEHRRRLKTVQSAERKAEVKASYIPDYVDYLKGVIQAGTGQQNEVLTTIMVWCIDAALYGQALDLADYVVAHNMAMPDQYKRTAATFIAEEFANAGIALADSDKSVAIEHLERVRELVADQDIYDPVRAKLMKALGITYDAQQNYEAATEHYAKALQLDPKSGVKRLMETAQRAAKKVAESEPSSAKDEPNSAKDEPNSAEGETPPANRA